MKHAAGFCFYIHFLLSIDKELVQNHVFLFHLLKNLQFVV